MKQLTVIETDTVKKIVVVLVSLLIAFMISKPAASSVEENRTAEYHSAIVGN